MPPCSHQPSGLLYSVVGGLSLAVPIGAGRQSPRDAPHGESLCHFEFVLHLLSFLTLIVVSFCKVLGIFMEIDARDQSFQSSIDRQIEEAHREENLVAIGNARGQLAAF